jgi:hypothetical protein
MALVSNRGEAGVQKLDISMDGPVVLLIARRGRERERESKRVRYSPGTCCVLLPIPCEKSCVELFLIPKDQPSNLYVGLRGCLADDDKSVHL